MIYPTPVSMMYHHWFGPSFWVCLQLKPTILSPESDAVLREMSSRNDFERNIFDRNVFNLREKYIQKISEFTLISLINAKSTLTDFEKFNPPQKENPPSTFIDFINIFHPPRLFQPPRLHYLVIITIFSPLFYSLQAVQWQFFNWNEVDSRN